MLSHGCLRQAGSFASCLQTASKNPVLLAQHPAQSAYRTVEPVLDPRVQITATANSAAFSHSFWSMPYSYHIAKVPFAPA